MFAEYDKESGISVNYQAIGSGAGVRNIFSGVVDFAATDIPLSAEERTRDGVEVIQIPMIVGSVVLAYNVPMVDRTQNVRLTGDIICGMYEGSIRYWDDPKIVAYNKDIQLPHIPVIPVYRADGSGTTHIFSAYLSFLSQDWMEMYGEGKTLSWPVGVGQKGNAGVAGYIKHTKGAIGYLEFSYAYQNALRVASVYNHHGVLITASALQKATQYSSEVSIDTENPQILLIANAKEAAPIASFSWILLRTEQKYGRRTKEQALATKKAIAWMLTTGQAYALPLHYVPLLERTQRYALRQLERLVYDGKPLQ